MTQLSSVAGLDGWRSSSTYTVERGTRSDDKTGLWDPTTVFGVIRSDEVLVIGNAAFMPWLSEVKPEITSIRKPNQLTALISDQRFFDKVVIARETEFHQEFVPLAGALLKMGGHLIVFSKDDGWELERVIEFYYPEARRWSLDSMFGRALVAELPGLSWRMHGDV